MLFMVVTTLGDEGASPGGGGATPVFDHPSKGEGATPVFDHPSKGEGATPVFDHPSKGEGATPVFDHPSKGGECFSGTKVKFNFSAICFTISGLRLGVRSVDGLMVCWSVGSG